MGPGLCRTGAAVVFVGVLLSRYVGCVCESKEGHATCESLAVFLRASFHAVWGFLAARLSVYLSA